MNHLFSLGLYMWSVILLFVSVILLVLGVGGVGIVFLVGSVLLTVVGFIISRKVKKAMVKTGFGDLKSFF